MILYVFPINLSFCLLIRTYKAWYYGLYINTARNIIIDSCTISDGNVGIFTLVMGPPGRDISLTFIPFIYICLFFSLATSHIAGNNSVIIRNSIIIGSITPNDCNDTLNATSINIINSQQAIPTVSSTSSSGNSGGRSGIVFPSFSGDNMMPRHPWTGIGAYPCSKFNTKQN